MSLVANRETVVKGSGLTAKVTRGRWGSYHYRSPRFGTKIGYHYNLSIYVFEPGNLNYVAHLMVKEMRRAEILQYLEAVKRTLEELRGPKNPARLVHLHNATRELGIRR